MTLAAWAGNVTQAHRTLLEEGLDIPPSTLKSWIRGGPHQEEYERIREETKNDLEQFQIRQLRQVAIRSTDVQMLAIEKAEAALEANQDRQPAQTAANLSKVTQVATDKLQLLTGKPTSITDHRDATEILRGLVARGVLKLADEPQQITEGS